MSPSTTMSGRTTWLIIWTAITTAPLIYALIASTALPGVPPSPMLGFLRGVLLAASAVAAALGTLLLSRASRVNGNLAPPAQFQLRSVTAMALFESIAVFGYVLSFQGAPPSQIWLWSGASLVLMVAVALPKGLGYWSEWEQAADRGPAERP